MGIFATEWTKIAKKLRHQIVHLARADGMKYQMDVRSLQNFVGFIFVVENINRHVVEE